MSNGLSSKSDHWVSIRTRQRGDGNTSYNVLYHLGGKQRSLTLRDPLVADAFAAAVKAHGAEAALEMNGYEVRPTGLEASAITVADWIRRYIDNLTGVEQYTLDCYERFLRQDIAPTLGSIQLTRLTEEHIAAWVKRLETTKRAKTGRVPSPKTIANIHGFLSGALGAAVPKHIPANPCAGRRLPRSTGDGGSKDGDDMRILTHEEFAAMREAIIEPYRPMLRFMVISGFRWGELSALRPGDVDRHNRIVRVRRAWKYSSAGYKLGPPKTRRSRREINVSAELLDELDYSQEWLFTNADKGPVRYQAFRPIFDRAAAKAELAPQPTPHDMRHTCASWLLAAGHPMIEVSRYLGHENISTTVNLYGHVNRAAHEAIADTMAKLLAT